MPRTNRGCETCGIEIKATESNTFLETDTRAIVLCDRCRPIFEQACKTLGLGSPEPIGAQGQT